MGPVGTNETIERDTNVMGNIDTTEMVRMTGTGGILTMNGTTKRTIAIKTGKLKR